MIQTSVLYRQVQSILGCLCSFSALSAKHFFFLHKVWMVSVGKRERFVIVKCKAGRIWYKNIPFSVIV